MLLPLGKTLLTKFFFGNFLLTKMMARTKLFWPQRRHKFSRVCVFSTLADNPPTNSMRRKTRRGGVAYGGQDETSCVCVCRARCDDGDCGGGRSGAPRAVLSRA